MAKANLLGIACGNCKQICYYTSHCRTVLQRVLDLANTVPGPEQRAGGRTITLRLTPGHSATIRPQSKHCQSQDLIAGRCSNA